MEYFLVAAVALLFILWGASVRHLIILSERIDLVHKKINNIIHFNKSDIWNEYDK